MTANPSTPALTRAQRRQASDRRMLQAAMKLIAEKGVARTTLADVGRAAGYSRGLPVERFGTKLGLLEAMVDSFENWFAEHAPQTIRGARGLAGVRARIAAHIENGLATPVGTRVVLYFYVESSFGVPELRPRVRALLQTFIDGFRVHLIEAREAGEIAPDADVDGLATLIVSMISGAFIEWMLSGGQTDLRAMTPLLQRMVSDALSRQGGRATTESPPRPESA